jgi:hypothetical protein
LIITILDLVFLVGLLGSAALFANALFWALNVRRAMFVKSYREQLLALTFVIAAVIVFPGPLSIFIPSPVNVISNVISWIAISTPILVIFYWMDSSLRNAKKSDPLVREILGWNKIRQVLWPVQIALVVYVGLFQARLLPVWAQIALFIVPYLIMIVSGALFLPIAARRTKDRTLRRHLMWFGIFFLCLVLVFIGGIDYPSFTGALETFAGLFAAGYALYRSAIALAPLKKPEIVVGTP